MQSLVSPLVSLIGMCLDSDRAQIAHLHPRFSYAVAFGALIATLAAEFDFWTGTGGNKVLDGSVIYLAIPLLLVATNALGVKVCDRPIFAQQSSIERLSRS
jgi:hypothetical protein